MNNIKIKTLFITSLFLIFFSGCSGLFNLTPDSSADDNNTFSIVLNNEASNRNITPYELTAERLSLVKEWKIKFTDLEGKTYAYTESSENGKITLKLPFIGNCSIEIEGSFTADGKTFSLKGSKSNVSVTAGSSVNISVEIIKNGTGTLNYKLKLDDTWGEIYSQNSILNKYFRNYSYESDEFLADLAIEKDDDITCFKANLTSSDTKDTISLDCYVFCKGWVQGGNYVKKFEYFEISYGEQIPAGTYILTVLADDESVDKGISVDISPFDNIVEIFGDTETKGQGISYNLNSTGTVFHYYVTKNQSSFNGFTPKSRANFSSLVKTLCNTMHAYNKVYMHFSEDEGINDYKDWEIWKEWKQPFNLYGIKGDYPANEQIFDGDDFYMGNYKTIFATFDAEKAATGFGTGLGPDNPINANLGYVNSYYTTKADSEYTIYYTDISLPENYAAITSDLSDIDNNIKNIILQTSNGYSKFENWNWEASCNYSLTLGSGINTVQIHDSSVTSITLGDDFETIEDNSFAECFNLVNITLGKNVNYIKSNAFNGLNSETVTITFPPTTEEWYYEFDGEFNKVTDFDTDKIINEILSSSDMRRIPTPVDFGVPYVMWSGKNDDPNSFNNFNVSNKISIIPAPLISPEGFIIDFTFDKNGNLYTTTNDGSGQNYLTKYVYNGSGYDAGNTIEDATGNSRTTLYYDCIQDIVYAKNETTIKSCNGMAVETYDYEEISICDPYAIHNKNVYFYNPSTRKIDLLVELKDNKVSKLKPEEVKSFVVYGKDDETDKDADTGLTDNIGGMGVTDIQVVKQGENTYMYVLVRQVADGFYSRGAVVRLIINEDGSLTYKDKLGWYNEKALNLDYEDNTNHQTETLESFKTKYFAGPEKFVAIKPDELVIADDGGYCYRDSQIRAGNINRIVTVDLDSFTINSSYDVNDEFNDEIAFGTNCSYIDDLIVR